ncbi:uncharacterized protein DFL_004893 [Arthrobotrys flagrans]|uniref:Uncharacterized protein n=1 Tax=Arthrobotrys flagrans TaxID=97331 RepID=A0A437A6F5_ARTFL|nr:hypothetical protein DFL_004893 [Arthrobotrys flagrans]
MKNGNGKGFKSTDDWNRIVNRVRDLVIETIERRTGARDLKAAIASERVNAPTTWQERFNLEKSGILGLLIDFWNALAFRPKTNDNFWSLLRRREYSPCGETMVPSSPTKLTCKTSGVFTGH